MDSPEDRLLRLIKGGKAGKPHAQQAEEPRQGPKGLDALRAKMRTGLPKDLLNHQFFFKINIALVAIMAALLVIFTVSFFIPHPSEVNAPLAAKGPNEEVLGPAAGGTGLAGQPTEGTAEAYMQAVAGKNLFSASVGGGQDAAANAELAGGDVSKRFNLVGIIAGPEPQAIVEDTELSKTYYLNKGQTVAGISIEDITDGRVVLSFNGKKIVLVL